MDGRSGVLVIACALAITACKKEQPPAPAPVPVGALGTWCPGTGCNEPLVCGPQSGRCVAPDDPEMVAAREAERDAERRYLEQSGVPAATTAEQPQAPPSVGSIRVVTTTTGGTRSTVFAACRADERLVSGGCKLDSPIIVPVDSYPSHHGVSDTLGARWNCRAGANGQLELEAYALCQRTTVSP
jgi:hypothetical protein